MSPLGHRTQSLTSPAFIARILRDYDLVTSLAYIVLSAADEFKHKTRRVHELWQTDFTYLKIMGWGWYYLSIIMDDYSRYIIAWLLNGTMAAGDVKETLEMAVAKSDFSGIKVRHRPRLLSDNGPATWPVTSSNIWINRVSATPGASGGCVPRPG